MLCIVCYFSISILSLTLILFMIVAIISMLSPPGILTALVLIF